MKASLTLECHRDVAALGPAWNALFADAGLQSSRAWIAATAEAALPAGAEPALLAVSDAAGPLALLPMLSGPDHRWGSLTTPYTCLYQPLLRTDPPAPPGALVQAARYCRRWPVTRFEALDPAAASTILLRDALGSAGLLTRSFANFGNWHEELGAASWDDYLAARPGALRETIRRRTRAALRAGVRLELARAGSALGAALRAYEAVYRRSWKEPEPFPEFNAALIGRLAAAGVLRIGVMWSGDTPIAAQYWSIDNGAATVLKLAHDEAFKMWSPGTVLTAATIRELMSVDGITSLDFGRGDDPYKRGWASQRRLRVGLLGLNVRTVGGLGAWARQDGGALLRRVRSLQTRGTAAGAAETETSR